MLFKDFVRITHLIKSQGYYSPYIMHGKCNSTKQNHKIIIKGGPNNPPLVSQWGISPLCRHPHSPHKFLIQCLITFSIVWIWEISTYNQAYSFIPFLTFSTTHSMQHSMLGEEILPNNIVQYFLKYRFHLQI